MKLERRKKVKSLLAVPAKYSITTRFPASTDERIRITAAQLQISMAEVVRQLVGKAIDENIEINPYFINKKSKRRRQYHRATN